MTESVHIHILVMHSCQDLLINPGETLGGGGACPSPDRQWQRECRNPWLNHVFLIIDTPSPERKLTIQLKYKNN